MTKNESEFNAAPPSIRLAGAVVRRPLTSGSGVSYPLKLGDNRQLRLQFDWFNVTNAQRALRQDETLRTNSGIPGAQSIQFPNPFFGQGTIFQYPSSLRIGIKFQF